MVIGLFCGKWPNKDKTSYGSSPPCTASLPSYCDVRNVTVAAVAKWAKSPVNTADRIRSDSICSVDWAFSSVGNSCNCHNKGPQEGDHRLSTEVTSLDGAPSLLAFMLLWGISRRSFMYGSHLAVHDQSSLAEVRRIIPTCPASCGFPTSPIWMSRHIAANFLERLLTIAANFFGMVDATIAAIHVMASAYMRPGLTTYILRVATRLFVYSNTRPVTPRWMLH